MKRVSQASCLAAAKKKWGKQVYIRENKRAITPAERASRLETIKYLKEEIAGLDEQIKSLGEQWTRLLESAEFFLSVNGDEPSGDQFRAAVADARKLVELKESRRAADSQRRELHGSTLAHRWDAIESGSFCSIVHASGDTLEELLQKIESRN